MTGEGAWALLPHDVIQLDQTTQAQEALLARRAARGALTEAAMLRRRQRLCAYFSQRPGAQGCPPPPAGFFQACHKVARASDAPTAAARRASVEAAAREAREQEGSWLTVWPEDGKWPSASKWAARHGVVHNKGGFAFASEVARRGFERRLARRERARRARHDASAAAPKPVRSTPPLKACAATAGRADRRLGPTTPPKPKAKKASRGGGKRDLLGHEVEGEQTPPGSPDCVIEASLVSVDLSSLDAVSKSIASLLLKAKPLARRAPA